MTAIPTTTNCPIGCGWVTRPHLVVPYSLTTNDSKFGRGVFGAGEDFFAYLKDDPPRDEQRDEMALRIRSELVRAGAAGS